ncbi:MAG: uncharacterized protein A8A55_1853 [Amphiamblys sp. WSBS2006]|nr:MAG: uncharacterized protein A8A55_1853 [Amphiamblys sp. WSBS2006]
MHTTPQICLARHCTTKPRRGTLGMSYEPFLLDEIQKKTEALRKSFDEFIGVICSTDRDNENALGRVIEKASDIVAGMKSLKKHAARLSKHTLVKDGWKDVLETEIESDFKNNIEILRTENRISITEKETGIQITLGSTSLEIEEMKQTNDPENTESKTLAQMKLSTNRLLQKIREEDKDPDEKKILHICTLALHCFGKRLGEKCPQCLSVFRYEEEIGELLPPTWITVGKAALGNTLGLLLIHRECLNGSHP